MTTETLVEPMSPRNTFGLGQASVSGSGFPAVGSYELDRSRRDDEEHFQWIREQIRHGQNYRLRYDTHRDRCPDGRARFVTVDANICPVKPPAPASALLPLPSVAGLPLSTSQNST